MNGRLPYSTDAFAIHDELVRIASKYTSGIAEDVVSEVYARLHVYDIGGKVINNVQAFARTMTRNMAITMNRRELKYAPPEQMPAEVADMPAERWVMLAEYLEHLPPLQQEFATLHYLWGYTLREVSVILNMSRSQAGRMKAMIFLQMNDSSPTEH